jgi:hypothetical protein
MRNFYLANVVLGIKMIKDQSTIYKVRITLRELKMDIKWKFNLLMIVLCAIPVMALAANQSGVITFNKYENARCQDYTGTWIGFIGEPKMAKSWPATVSLYSSDSKIVGNIESSVDIEKPRQKIWADCKSGALSNVFWGEKGECGGYSQEAFLLDKNTLILKLHYETLNQDTYFLAFLKRENAKYSLPALTNPKDLEPGVVKTCHAKWQH